MDHCFHRTLAFALGALVVPLFNSGMLYSEESAFPTLSKTDSEDSPVEVRLIVKQECYVLPKGWQGDSFRRQIESETDSDRLPPAPQVKLIFHIKNTSNENVTIWPRGLITYPELEVKGAGVVEPKNLHSLTGESAGSSVQITIPPGKSHKLKIDSLNPNGGTCWYYWCKPGEYEVTATYRVYTGLPPFPFQDDSSHEIEGKLYEVKTKPVTLSVVLEAE